MTHHPAIKPARESSSVRRRCARILAIGLSLFVPLSLLALAPVAAQDKKKDDKKVDKKDEKKEPDQKEPEKKEPPKLDTPAKSLKGHTDWVNSISFSQDGKYLASGSRDRTVKIWDAAAGKDIHTHKMQPEKTKGVPGVKAVTFVGAGDRVAATTGHWDIKQKEWRGEIKVFEGAAGNDIRTIEGHTETIEAVAATRDGKRLASAAEDRLVKIWDLDTGKDLFTLKGHAGQVLAVAFTRDGKLLASGGEDKTEPKKETPKETKKDKKDTKDKKDAKDKKDVKDKEKDKEKDKKDVKDKIDVKDKKDPKEVKKETPPPPVPILLWNAETGKEAGTLLGPGRAVTCLAFNPDGTRLAAAGLDGTIKIFDIPGKKEVRTLTAHDGVWAVAFSNDGKRLATGGYDWKIRIWDADTGAELRTIVAHTGTVTCLAFSPDGQTLASGGLDQLINLWS